MHSVGDVRHLHLNPVAHRGGEGDAGVQRRSTRRPHRVCDATAHVERWWVCTPLHTYGVQHCGKHVQLTRCCVYVGVPVHVQDACVQRPVLNLIRLRRTEQMQHWHVGRQNIAHQSHREVHIRIETKPIEHVVIAQRNLKRPLSKRALSMQCRLLHNQRRFNRNDLLLSRGLSVTTLNRFVCTQNPNSAFAMQTHLPSVCRTARTCRQQAAVRP